MDIKLKDKLTETWSEYFPGADLPITFQYSHTELVAERVNPGSVPLCIIAAIGEVRK